MWLFHVALPLSHLQCSSCHNSPSSAPHSKHCAAAATKTPPARSIINQSINQSINPFHSARHTETTPPTLPLTENFFTLPSQLHPLTHSDLTHPTAKHPLPHVPIASTDFSTVSERTGFRCHPPRSSFSASQSRRAELAHSHFPTPKRSALRLK
jgi:hypothetical protein